MVEPVHGPPPADWWRPHLPAGTELDRAALTATTLPAAWSGRWAEDPSAPTLCFAGTVSGATWLSAGELEARSRRAAGRLALLGLGRGNRMLWSSGPSADAVVACLAALRMGAVVVPVNPAYTAAEVAHVVGDVEPTLALVAGPEQERQVTAAAEGAQAGPVTVVSPALEVQGPGAGAARRPAAGGRLQDEPPGGLDGVGPQEPAMVVYTSGTTGRPKGAVLSHANLAAGLAALRLAWRWTPEDRLVLALPLFHVHGLCAGLLGTLAAGASAVVLPRFEVAALLDAAADHDATLFFGVPTMYHRLASSPRMAELAELRLCVSGSAPLAPELWEAARRGGGVEVLERYGMTETLLTVSNPYDGPRRPGTIGLPLPGVEVRLVGGAGSARTPASGGAGGEEAAELQVRGPSVFAGYWRRPAASAEAFDGSWFCTRDLVSVGEDGYLSVRGRHSDLIISGGFNVYPAEVEEALLAHPGVAEAAVAGVPSAEWGEEVTAWVVPAAGRLHEADLMAFAAERLAPYKRPRRVHQVEALPRNAMGKVQRSQLR